MSRPGFWDNREMATKQAEHAGVLREELGDWDTILDETKQLLQLLKNDSEDEDLISSIEEEYVKIVDHFNKLEFTTLFRGKYDERNAILAIHAGSGGTEAQDWAEMLLRMYLRFAEMHKIKSRVIDESRGQEAGIKSITVHFNGRFAYGYLKGEYGVHRLVRISPFDAEKMRHTSFALVEVLPELEELEEQQIDPNDLRVDTFLSSGHGGQSVNTTYSAVRIVHIPTGITVSCQNERSQQQNKETALKILQAKLHRLAIQEQADEKQKLRGSYQSAEWGNQIRSYVLQPYRLVKDHRTAEETSDTEAILDGKLDKFSEAYLRWELKNSPKPKS